jgi:uncharacterized membrane protein
MSDDVGGSDSAKRLDALVDAAFAFAVTLLVIGGGDVPSAYADLDRAMRNAPAFAIGFAFIAMFWHGHVRWRAHRHGGGVLPVLLTLFLVFLVLVFVYPLRLMAISLVEFISRDVVTIRAADEVANLFLIYGLGFMAMAGTMAALFGLTLFRRAHDPESRDTLVDERAIWLILASSGLISALVSRVTPAAPWVYALLPIPITLYMQSRRRARRAPEAEPAADA